MRNFPTELIYDAATDEAALERLSVHLTEFVGARSGVIHWSEIGSKDEHVSYSGYYSADHMALYATEFSDYDLWARAISCTAQENRAINLSQVVPSRVYEDSRIYNEWIRPMGDDTFHCLGATVTVGRIKGQLGFHRGRDQTPFDSQSVTLLEQVLSHVGRMMVIRTRLSTAERKAAAVTDTLDALGDGLFTLDPRGRLLSCNTAGEAILRVGDGLRLDRGFLSSTVPEVNKNLTTAIFKAALASCAEASTLRVPRICGEDYILGVVGTGSGGRRSVTVCVSDPKRGDRTLASHLRSLHGLTQAEAEISVRLAAGASISDLADERCTSVATVRTQVKATAFKLGCGRQAEIAAIVNSIPRLSGF